MPTELIGYAAPTLLRTPPSPLSQALLPIFEKRRKQVGDDGTRARLDLSSDGHAGREIDAVLLHLHLRAVERDARRIDEFLALGLARSCRGAGRRVNGFVLRFVARNGVLRNAQHLAVNESVAREIEGVDLDFNIVAHVDEADV